MTEWWVTKAGKGLSRHRDPECGTINPGIEVVPEGERDDDRDRDDCTTCGTDADLVAEVLGR